MARFTQHLAENISNQTWEIVSKSHQFLIQIMSKCPNRVKEKVAFATRGTFPMQIPHLCLEKSHLSSQLINF